MEETGILLHENGCFLSIISDGSDLRNQCEQMVRIIRHAASGGHHINEPEGVVLGLSYILSTNILSNVLLQDLCIGG